MNWVWRRDHCMGAEICYHDYAIKKSSNKCDRDKFGYTDLGVCAKHIQPWAIRYWLPINWQLFKITHNYKVNDFVSIACLRFSRTHRERSFLLTNGFKCLMQIMCFILFIPVYHAILTHSKFFSWFFVMSKWLYRVAHNLLKIIIQSIVFRTISSSD